MPKDRTGKPVEAQAPTVEMDGKRYIPCPYGCGLVREEKLPRHLRRNHTNSPALIKVARSAKMNRSKNSDALSHSVSGGRVESNRRKH